MYKNNHEIFGEFLDVLKQVLFVRKFFRCTKTNVV